MKRNVHAQYCEEVTQTINSSVESLHSFSTVLYYTFSVNDNETTAMFSRDKWHMKILISLERLL